MIGFGEKWCILNYFVYVIGMMVCWATRLWCFKVNWWVWVFVAYMYGWPNVCVWYIWCVCVCAYVELYVNYHDSRKIGDVCITLSLCVTLWLRLMLFRFCRVVLGMMKQVCHWHEIWHGACHENASWWNLGMEMKKALRSRRESRRWRKIGIRLSWLWSNIWPKVDLKSDFGFLCSLYFWLFVMYFLGIWIVKLTLYV